MNDREKTKEFLIFLYNSIFNYCARFKKDEDPNTKAKNNNSYSLLSTYCKSHLARLFPCFKVETPPMC